MKRKRKRIRRKKYFTLSEANARLPLLESILRDVTDLAPRLKKQHERVLQLQSLRTPASDSEFLRELDDVEADFRCGRERMEDLEKELHELGVELKDYFTGLVDFPSIMEDREVYLCWRLGEKEVCHWHELDAGYAGRRPFAVESLKP